MKKEIEQKITELEAQLKPLQDQLRDIHLKEGEEIEAKVKRCQRLQDAFTPDKLTFSAEARCECGAGLAYPKTSITGGAWHCSDILLGRAKPKSDPESKTHSGPYPFAFYEIKSEGQPSAHGHTTRPKE